MNLLVSQEELASTLARRFIRNNWLKHPFEWTGVDAYVKECREEYRRSQHIVIDFNHVNKLINKEINAYKQRISANHKNEIKPLINYILDNNVLGRYSQKSLLKLYEQDPRQTFIKSIGPQLSDNYKFISSLADADPDQPYLIRNIIHNEILLQLCMKHRWPFWFIDTGYTNFLNDKRKTWHRLVRNHIHHGPVFIDYPDDRLDLLPAFPNKWRKKGRTVLVVESSDNHYHMMGTTRDKWRYWVEHDLKLHTDRPIEIRSKNTNKKTRSSVYDLLINSKEYYCVISDCSNAATEAVWAGVPAITLNRHITNSVTRNTLADIENLYKSDIESWLRAVSYNQFSFEELCNGTAIEIIKTYGSL